MAVVVLACIGLLVLTTLVHFEVLFAMSRLLPRIALASRFKLLLVIAGTFMAHVIEIVLYAVALYLMLRSGLGTMSGKDAFSFNSALYFSAETYTSLGFGDVVPTGPLRLLAGTETLNGLLLIGWSASFTYLSMERFWSQKGHR